MISNRTYGMDNDVISYNARIVAGGNQSLSMQSLRQLNQFIKEIKKIGIWDDMVCWPMRQSYNAGSGATVYSLGGFAKSTFNGSIINNGTWTPNGILLNLNLSSSIYVSNFIINDLIKRNIIIKINENILCHYKLFMQELYIAESLIKIQSNYLKIINFL